MEQINHLIARKYSAALADEKGRRRTIAALQRLGFRWEDIRQALKEFELSDE